MCEIVSLPEPVASTYATWFGERMAREEEGRPLGDTFTCLPEVGAEAVKKTDWARAHSERLSSI